jgi:hypothetical protein
VDFERSEQLRDLDRRRRERATVSQYLSAHEKVGSGAGRRAALLGIAGAGLYGFGWKVVRPFVHLQTCFDKLELPAHQGRRFYTDFSECNAASKWDPLGAANLLVEKHDGKMSGVPMGPLFASSLGSISNGSVRFKFRPRLTPPNQVGQAHGVILRGQDRENCYVFHLSRTTERRKTVLQPVVTTLLGGSAADVAFGDTFTDEAYTVASDYEIGVMMNGSVFHFQIFRELGGYELPRRPDGQPVGWLPPKVELPGIANPKASAPLDFSKEKPDFGLFREGHIGLWGPDRRAIGESDFRVYSVEVL